MTEKISGSEIINNFIWKFMERSGLQLVNLLVQIVLARILMPADFAIVAIIMVFITIANIFVQTGFGTALIQRKDIDNKDCSTIFFSSIFISVVIVSILFLVSPYIAKFYNMDELTVLIRAQSLIVFIGSFNTVQQAVMSRRMQFKKNFQARIIACVASGVIGIISAYNGFGVWSIIVLNILNNLIYTVILWITVKWRPQMFFSIVRFNSLFSFSWKLIVANLIGTIYDNVRTLVIGKFFDKNFLGYYNRADTVSVSIMGGITSSISAIMLPVLSRYQDDKKAIKEKLRKTFEINCFICVPMMFGLAAVADNVMVALFTEKWLDAGAFLSILCIGYSFYPIHTANLQAIYAIGKSDVVLKLEIAKKTIGMALVLISIPFGVYAIAFSVVVMSLISIVINNIPNLKYIGYSLKEQIKDIGIYYIMSIVMAIITCVFVKLIYIEFVWVRLILQVMIGIFIYLIECWLFKPYAYEYCKSLLIQKIKKI